VPFDPKGTSVKAVIASTKRFWEEHKEKMYENLAKFYNVERLPLADLTAYFSRTPQCPYDWNEKLFAIPMFGNYLTRIGMIQHELMHYYFWSLKWPSRLEPVGFTKEQIETIKEALTVFLNDELKFEKFVDDKGYTGETELRNIFWENRDKITTIEDALPYAKAYFRRRS